MTRPARIRWINATGILLAFFGFAFSPWLGSQSALGLLVELANFLRTSPPGADIGRQQAIFAILGAILLCLLFQALAFVFSVRKGNARFLFQETVFAVLVLALLALLFFGFQARAVGLWVTGVTTLVAAIAALLNQNHVRTVSARQTRDDLAVPEATDSMLDFQRQVAQAFHRSAAAGKPFSLALIGIVDFQELSDVFGAEAATEIFVQLIRFLADLAPDIISTAFSTGAVMTALPNRTQSQAQALLAQAVEKMGRHGFPGEMLLPGGHVRMHSHVVSRPDDGDNLAQLTERVLEGYAEKSTQP